MGHTIVTTFNQWLRFFRASEHCSSDKNVDLSDTFAIGKKFSKFERGNLSELEENFRQKLEKNYHLRKIISYILAGIPYAQLMFSYHYRKKLNT